MKVRAILAALFAFACRTSEPTYVEGGLYSVPHENGKYIVVKILKVDAGGVHVRSYSNLFDQRPRDVDESKLYMADIDHKSSEALGMGHLPVAKESFRQWDAQLIKVVRVRDDELEGYRMWLDAKGGYFN
jgi:hypothetical protein